MHFGLGGEDRIEKLEVTWPSGQRQVLENVGVDRVLEVREPDGSAGLRDPLGPPRFLGTRPTGVPRNDEGPASRPAPHEGEPSGS